MNKRLIKALLPLAVLGAGVGGAAYLRATKPHVEAQPAHERIWPVATVEAAPVEKAPEFRAFGMVVAGRKLELRPLVAGRIIEVGDKLVEGGVVRQGELLLAIEPFDFAVAVDQRRAELAEAAAKLAEIEADLKAEMSMLESDREQVKISERDVARRTTLREKSATSEKALDDSRMLLSERREAALVRQQTVDRLSARGEQQRANVNFLEAALRRSQRDLERTRIVAPFDAFVVETVAAVGQQVSTADRLARLIDSARLDARFHLSAGAFSRLIANGEFRNLPVRVVWRLGTEMREFTALIERQEAEIDPSTGGVELFARIKGTGPKTILRPGAFV